MNILLRAIATILKGKWELGKIDNFPARRSRIMQIVEFQIWPPYHEKAAGSPDGFWVEAHKDHWHEFVPKP